MTEESEYQPWRTAGFVFRLVWVSAGASVLMLALHLVNPKGDIPGIAMGIAAGGMMQCLMVARMDGYYRSLYAMGQTFLTAYASLCLTAFWFLDAVNAEGRIAALLRPWLADGYLIAICGAVVFYAGYAFAWLRDRL